MQLYDIPLRTLDGAPTTLRDYENAVVLVVNVASKCGFTPQYTGLEDLYQKYKDRGFVVLGFPCDQFGHQEPGTAAEIQQFCSLTYNVSFPLFEKIEVNGSNAHALYATLKEAAPGVLGTRAIKWNFTKFLIAPKASSIRRYGPRDTPASIASAIEALLARR